MYILIEYSHNYLKTSGSLWQYNWYDQNANLQILNHSNLKQK